MTMLEVEYFKGDKTLTRLPLSALADSHLRLIEVDDDFQVGRPVGGSVGHIRLQLRGEAGLQPLGARHHLDSLHPLLADAKRLAAKILHLLVVHGIEFVEA